MFINTLYNLWPDGDRRIPGLRDGIAKAAPTVFPKYGIDSNLLIAHLMAQGSLECGAGVEVEENLSYSTQRMTQVWPSRFPSINNAVPFAHNPRSLANKVYNGRMGNALNSNDGWNYRGRGFTQTTGLEGYAKLQYFLAKGGIKLDLLNHPELVNDPEHFLECGVADFILCGCLPWAQADNVAKVTLHLNGGYTDLAQRVGWLLKWKAALR
jgi:putative chitinase